MQSFSNPLSFNHSINSINPSINHSMNQQLFNQSHNQPQLSPMLPTTPSFSILPDQISSQSKEVRGTEYLRSGLFEHEKVWVFLYIMQRISEACLYLIRDVVEENKPSPQEFINQFRRGLASITTWTISTKTNEAKNATREFPELNTLYKYTVVMYLKELFKHEQATQIPISLVPLSEFIHVYYSELAKTPCVQQMVFFKIYGIERTYLHVETLRNALFEITRGQLNLVGSRPQGLVREDRDISPDDSVTPRQSRFISNEQNNNQNIPPPNQQNNLQMNQQNNLQMNQQTNQRRPSRLSSRLSNAPPPLPTPLPIQKPPINFSRRLSAMNELIQRRSRSPSRSLSRSHNRSHSPPSPPSPSHHRHNSNRHQSNHLSEHSSAVRIKSNQNNHQHSSGNQEKIPSTIEIDIPLHQLRDVKSARPKFSD